jgi:hypothetical protein
VRIERSRPGQVGSHDRFEAVRQIAASVELPGSREGPGGLVGAARVSCQRGRPAFPAVHCLECRDVFGFRADYERRRVLVRCEFATVTRSRTS